MSYRSGKAALHDGSLSCLALAALHASPDHLWQHKREALYHTLRLGTVCICRCFGVTSWQTCSGIRGHRHVHQKMRGQHTATAAAVDQQTATAEVPKSNKQQQKKQSGQKNSKNSGGKDKKSELAVTPKSEDFAR